MAKKKLPVSLNQASLFFKKDNPPFTNLSFNKMVSLQISLTIEYF